MRIAPSVAVALVFVAAACGKSEETAVKPPPDPVATLPYAELKNGTSEYKRKTCVIHEDKDLSTLGHPPFVISYRGYEVQFCSKDCLKEFAEDPETIILTKVNPRAIFRDGK